VKSCHSWSWREASSSASTGAVSERLAELFARTGLADGPDIVLDGLATRLPGAGRRP